MMDNAEREKRCEKKVFDRNEETNKKKVQKRKERSEIRKDGFWCRVMQLPE